MHRVSFNGFKTKKKNQQTFAFARMIPWIQREQELVWLLGATCCHGILRSPIPKLEGSYSNSAVKWPLCRKNWSRF
jgi:hypothetical protein